jgi:hypothetical protein
MLTRGRHLRKFMSEAAPKDLQKYRDMRIKATEARKKERDRLRSEHSI